MSAVHIIFIRYICVSFCLMFQMIDIGSLLMPVVTKTRNQPKPAKTTYKTTYKTNQNDPKPATGYWYGRFAWCLRGWPSVVLRDCRVDGREVEFSRPYRVLHVKTLTKSQSVLSRWKQASRYIFATQTDVKSKLTINFRVVILTYNLKVLVSGPLLNTWTSVFDIFCLLTSLFRTRNGLDCI